MIAVEYTWSYRMRMILLLTLAATSLAATELRIRVTDEAGRPVWARLEIRGPDKKMYQPAGAVRDLTARSQRQDPRYVGSFVVRGECSLDVSPGPYAVIADRGLEFEREERSIEVRQKPAEATFRLRRWVRARDLGWWSGDLHIHRPPEQMEALALAEDLNISVVFTMWNKRNLWEGKPLPADPVMRFSPDHLATLMNAEDERGGGAWLLHGIPKPLPLAVDGRWYPPGIDFIRQARAGRAWFDCEKPIWWEVPVIMALEPPDSFGLLHNHFDLYDVLDHEAWGRPRDKTRFPGQRGFADYTIGLYYRYLNLGFRMPPSAGSASGVLPNPVGYNRVYARLDGPLSVEKWYAAMRDGRCFVTNGPMLFVSTGRSGAALKVKVEALAREVIDRVEIVANGEIVESVSPGAKSFRQDFMVNPERHSWLAVRCWLKQGETIRLAHSAPVYLPGKWDGTADAQYFVQWIDELIALSGAEPDRFRNAAEREEVMALYRRARAFYAEKILGADADRRR